MAVCCLQDEVQIHCLGIQSPSSPILYPTALLHILRTTMEPGLTPSRLGLLPPHPSPSLSSPSTALARLPCITGYAVASQIGCRLARGKDLVLPEVTVIGNKEHSLVSPSLFLQLPSPRPPAPRPAPYIPSPNTAFSSHFTRRRPPNRSFNQEEG